MEGEGVCRHREGFSLGLAFVWTRSNAGKSTRYRGSH